MSIWLRYGDRSERLDGLALFGRPPAVTPPRFALAARIWDSLGLTPDSIPTFEPHSWVEHALAALPAGVKRVAVAAPRTQSTGCDALIAALVAGLRARAIGECEILRGGAADRASLRDIGVTSAGTPVRLPAVWVEADWRIVLSGVAYDPLTGFNGGDDVVFPGLADPDARKQNRLLALDAKGELRAECRPGVRGGNPVRIDLEAAAALSPASWWIVALPVEPRDVDPASPSVPSLRVIQGASPGAWETARDAHDERSRVEFTARPRLFVSDAGGAPDDATLARACGSLLHAAEFVGDGGRLLFAASCAEGIELGPDPVLSPWKAATLRRSSARATVGLWSDLPSDPIARLGLVPITSRDEALRFLAQSGAEPLWGWLPRAERFLPAPGWRGGGARAD